ncbi:MAG: Ig-like domain-containing protein [candidate division KSB1 bacterium]|nr:Ig-like domain-containing protein [candidate division KSB1 bacterium]MDQ7064750.1 Ig-like domain-containing protein [candidate division KSB1 bacterium]
MKISWDPNTEADLAGYKIYYGTHSGQYDQVIDVGNVTQYRIGSLQPGKTYYFVVTAYDTARNESSPSKEVSATLTAEDTQPPRLVNVKPLAKNSLLVVFSEPVRPSTAESVANYEIRNGVRVRQARLNSDSVSVTLTTDDHQSGKTYILHLSNIQDMAEPPNTIADGTQWVYVYNSNDYANPTADTTAPFVLNVNVPSNNRVEVVFNEQVLPISAENRANYAISGGISIGQVKLQSDGRTVVMTTSLHQNGVDYLLTVRNIADLAEPPNIMPRSIQWTYTYHEEDHQAPRIVDVTMDDLQHVRVLFSEKVTPATAEKKENYHISDGIVVQSATLQENQREVMLVTSPHQLNRQYTLTVNGIKDQSPFQNQIAANSTFTYIKRGREEPPANDPLKNEGPIQVHSVSPDRYQLARLEESETYYVDESYQILRIPERLRNLVWIKTANGDRFNRSSSFLSFYLNEPGRVFVGYDSRATSWPTWLTSNFERTPYRIRVSGPALYMDVWEARVPAGQVTLGGNAAPEATSNLTMYVVLIETNLMTRDIGRQPREFVLYQNYPNPFNPRTEISFYLAKPSLVELKIFNAQGQRVRQLVRQRLRAGMHRYIWDATGDHGEALPSGTYFYVLEIKEEIHQGGFVLTASVQRQRKTMIYIR